MLSLRDQAGVRLSCLLSPPAFSMALEVLESATRQLIEIKDPWRKEKVKLFPFTDDMIPHVRILSDLFRNYKN